MQNTMDLRLKKISTYMIPLENVFMISEASIVDEDLLTFLETHTYSKVLVYSKYRSNIIGFIKIKNLLAVKLSEGKSLKSTGIIHSITKIGEHLTLLDAISELKQKNVNLAAVLSEDGQKSSGMITLKKIFEKLVLQEFADEDNHIQYKWNQD